LKHLLSLRHSVKRKYRSAGKSYFAPRLNKIYTIWSANSRLVEPGFLLQDAIEVHAIIFRCPESMASRPFPRPSAGPDFHIAIAGVFGVYSSLSVRGPEFANQGIGCNRLLRRHEQRIDIKFVQAVRMIGGKCGDRFDGIEYCLDIACRAATIAP